VTERKYKVLVVDDTQAMQYAAKSALDPDMFEVMSCMDGLEAVAAIARFAPDIVLVDILMPRLDGYETVSLIRLNEAFAEVPVLMMSSKGGVFDIAKGRLIGFDGVITKPFTAADLQTEVYGRLGLPAPGER